MFSETVQRILANPTHLGPLEEFTHTGTAGVKGDGAYMQIWLKCRGQESGDSDRKMLSPAGAGAPLSADIIVLAAFQTFGCPSATACGSMICALITGREVEKAKLITAADLLLILGGLPEGKEFCTELAVNSLREAVGCGRISHKDTKTPRTAKDVES